MENDKPCCPADALRRIRQIRINGSMTGITMLDECITHVNNQNGSTEMEIRAALIKRVSIYNYIPKSVEGKYADALIDEYRKNRSRQEKSL
ncbi:MAG: hypothetical protein WC342_07200 [Methanoregula sp.]|jgi:hypothetical protein